jgi:DUF1707 SHOCT-like domain
MSERGTALRVSDSEREAAVNALREHFFAGRLDLDEFKARVDEAYAARTHGELEAVARELPAVDEPQPARKKPWLLPGNTSFAVRVHTRRPPDEAVDDVVALVFPRLAGTGYTPELEEPAKRVFGRDERPGWTIAVAVLLFPLGLVALAYRSRSRVTVQGSRTENGLTAIDVYGTAPLAVRRVIRDRAAS